MGKRRGNRKGRCTRKNRALKAVPEPESVTKAPHSFVIHRGLPSKLTTELTKDFRLVMEPFTATRLKERKNNSIKDFVSIAGYLHVSHMCIFSLTKLGLYLKIVRLPRGPTLTFKVHNYTFTRDVISSLKKQYFLRKAFQNSPLIVMNSFSGEGMHLKLMANMFQNMFPTINVSNVQLKTIRRCVLLNFNPDTKLIDFRHYYIKIAPIGLTKGTKKIVQGKVPDLGRCGDIAEFFEKAGMLSESEQEDDPNVQIVLPQNLSTRGARMDSQSAIRLSELGPRLTLQLIKIEDGLIDGEVLFHEYIHKTQEEKELIRKKQEANKKLKEKRKKVQQENIKQKEIQKEEHKQKSLEGIKRKNKEIDSERLIDIQDDDDAEYYRQEVGEEPDQDLFVKNESKKRRLPMKDSSRKKIKFNDDKTGSNSSTKVSRQRKNETCSVNRNNVKKSRGRGGHPKYGWRAQKTQEQKENNNKVKNHGIQKSKKIFRKGKQKFKK